MFDRILVAVDFSEHSRRALDYALRLAGKHQAEVHVLHVVPQPWDYLPLDESLWGSEEAKTHALGDRILTEAQRGLDVFLSKIPEETRGDLEASIATGTPHEEILEAADTGGYDLVVVGTHGRTGVKHAILGSVAERVVSHAPCPVLTIH